MRARIRHNLFTAASALSMLVCLGLVGLWIRSCCVGDRFEYSLIARQGPPLVTAVHCIILRRGAIEYLSIRTTHGVKTTLADLGDWPRERVRWSTVSRSSGSWLRWFRFARVRSNIAAPAVQEFTELRIPFWFPCLLTAVPPAVWLGRRLRRHRRAKRGLCISCGYDLRASRERCPECGAEMTEKVR